MRCLLRNDIKIAKNQKIYRVVISRELMTKKRIFRKTKLISGQAKFDSKISKYSRKF